VDSRFRGNDKKGEIEAFCETIKFEKEENRKEEEE
jgi:hypothetical protein